MSQPAVPQPVPVEASVGEAGFVPVHRRVARCAALDPSALAVRHGDAWLSRGALLDRAGRLAGFLIERGVAPDSVVAVRLDRSIDHVVAWLAILLSGSAFMSLDPGDPTDRARQLIANAGAAAVITDAGRANDHPGLAVRIDDPAIAQATVPPPRIVARDDLAYVAHTSGSSGQPNAVEISHGNLANLVEWTIATFALTSADRTSLALGLGFDAAIFELWPALAAGAGVHIVDDLVRVSPDLLRRQLLEERITVATVPTVFAQALVEADWPADTHLRYLFTGGDVLRIRPRPGLPFRLINNYGPTECTCETTWAVVAPQTGADADLPAIGKPIAGVTVHLLDDRQQPVAPGSEGEIWIGGAGVGRGYRNDPALTAARFRADPFAAKHGARMYRTGDRGCLLPSGDLAFRGRHDRQVKIGGVRIELDEIAAALGAHPAVETAVVTARDDADAGRHIVAHVVPADPGRPAAAIDLRRFLLGRLPRAYVPGAFVGIEALPLTANGKIDHAALPAPQRDPGGAQPCEALSAPQRKVIEIVQAVLGRDDVALDANFFLLGGQSLQGTEVVVRCRDAFGVAVSLADLFAGDTIGDFVEAICARVAQHIATLSEAELQAALGAR